MENVVSIRERWLAAVAYLSILVLIPTIAPGKSPFLVRHCRQGFALFFVELIGIALILIIDASLGRIPILGFILAIGIRLVLFLLFLSLSALGFAKALFGEKWRIPFLDELADNIPIH